VDAAALSVKPVAKRVDTLLDLTALLILLLRPLLRCSLIDFEF
jgi:hypothetical protein